MNIVRNNVMLNFNFTDIITQHITDLLSSKSKDQDFIKVNINSNLKKRIVFLQLSDQHNTVTNRNEYIFNPGIFQNKIIKFYDSGSFFICLIFS